MVEINVDAAIDSYMGGSGAADKAPATQQKLQASMALSIPVAPDSYAEARKIAARTGVAVDTVLAQPNEMKTKAFMTQFDAVAFSTSNPSAADFLSEPNNAKIAHDDIENLTELEKQFGVWRAIPEEREPTFKNIARGLSQSLFTGFELTGQGIRQQAADLIGAEDISADAMRRAELARIKQFSMDPLFDGVSGIAAATYEGMYTGGKSVVQMAPGLAASMATGTVVPALALGGVQTQTEAYTRYRARGAEPLEAFAGAIGEGLIEVATELTPMGVIVNKFGKVGAKKFIGELLVKDLPGEQIATFTQDALDTAIANPDKTWADFMAERPDAAYQTAIATITAGGVVTGAQEGLYRTSGQYAIDKENAARQRVLNDINRAAKAEQDMQSLQAINELATNSKVRPRDPIAFQNFIEKAAEGTSIQDIYIDPKSLAQSGIDLKAMAEASPTVAAQVDMALNTGSDIKMPVSEFATHLAGSELGQQILEHIKTSPMAMSQFEANDYMKTQAESLQAEVDKVLLEVQADDVFRTSANIVRDNILNQLQTTNRFTSDVNTAYASLLSNFYAVQAARLKITPEEMFAQFPVTIQSTAIAGANLSQIPVDANGNVTLRHWSNEKRLKKTDPSKWGKTAQALPREERNRIGVAPGRTYFGIGNYRKEAQLGDFEYETTLPASSLYNMAEDPDDLRAKGRALRDSGKTDADGKSIYENMIKEAGYAGYIREGPNGTVAVVFNPTKVKAVKGKRDGESESTDRSNATASGSVRDGGSLRGGEQLLAQSAGPYSVDDQALDGAPGPVNVPGLGKIQFGPYLPAREAAAKYMAQAGLNYLPPTQYVKVDEDRAVAIAEQFEKMKHDPSDMLVKEAYTAMIKETLAQYQVIKETGLKIEFIEPGQADPYAASPRLAILDVIENNHLWVFPTDSGFGGTESADVNIDGNPLLNFTDEYIGERRMRANDVFRIVHDYFGHIKDGNGFRAEGEENAWQSHAAMFPPLARRAMTTETRGQNSWVNYGPFAGLNRTATAGDTQYAPQKIGLLPEWVSTDGAVAGESSGTPAEELNQSQASNPFIEQANIQQVQSPSQVKSAVLRQVKSAVLLGADSGGVRGVFSWSSLQIGDAYYATHADIARNTNTPFFPEGVDNRLWFTKYENGVLIDIPPELSFTQDILDIPALAPFFSREDFYIDGGSQGIITAKEYAEGLRDGGYRTGFYDFMEGIDTVGALNQENTAEPRGSFNPGTNTITLLRAADLSTFLHETGHFFLETLNKMATLPGAPEDVRGDMLSVLKWFGVEDIATWNAMGLEQQRESHEKFARAFELYLRNGDAPNIELRDIFQKFRAWLLNIYRSLSQLNVELTDEVRDVFNRLVATSEQIKEAELSRSFEPMFKTAQEAGMNQDEWQAYQDLGLEATQDAISTLDKRSIRDMRYASNAKSRMLKELQRTADGKRKAMRREVTDEIMSQPVYQAMTFLKKGIDPVTGEKVEGGHKISIPELEALYGDSNAIRNITAKLGFGKYGMLGTENAIHPDQVAEMFGFTSGDHLIRSLLGAENPRELIAALTDQRMLEKYGDLTDPDNMSRAADEAIHNEVRARFIATELAALQRATGGRKILAAAAKAFAENMIARLKVSEVRPARYTSAEVRAAKNADKARIKGDLAAAAIEKRNQLIQNYAAKSAFEALQEIEKTLRYLNKFNTAGTRKSIDTGYLDQIDSLLSRFDLRKGTTLKQIEKRKSLTEWLSAQEELGLSPEIPQELLDEANTQSYKTMTVEELRGLRDTVKQIEHLGRLKNKLLTAQDQRDFAATVADMVASINENAGGRVADNRTRANTMGNASRMFKGFLASHRKVASLARELDGIKDGGPVWETFVRSMNAAGDKEASMRAEATQNLAKLVTPVLEGGAMGGKGIYFESIGKSLNREERIGIALNTGNLGNYQRLLDGEGWSADQVRPVLDSLTEKDWQFVQSIWDYFETFRPEIAAKEKRIYGKEPAWIEPNPVVTPYGTLRGGYYPIKYDTRQSQAAEQFDDAEKAKAQMKGAFTSATTRRSFTKTRAEEVKGRPLLYSMDGLYQGVNEVIHDLSWHEWLIDVNRLMRSKSLDNAIRGQYGADVIKQIKSSIQDIAAGEMPAQNAWETSLGALRAGATIAGLGLNITNTLINVSGMSNSVVRVGARWVGQGVAKWAQNPRAMMREVEDKSDLMRLRSQTMLREINEIRNIVRGQSTARRVVNQIMFAPLAYSQSAVDMPTWWGAYQKALSEGNDERRSVALADQAVLDSQSGGQTKDLSAIQRGGPLQKLFTTFYGYFNAVYNLSVEQTKKTDFKDPLDVLRLGGDYLMLYSVPALWGTVIKTALLGEDDDWEPEKLASTLANEQLSYMFGMMVGLREVGNLAQTMAGVNPYNIGYSGPAGLRFFSELYKLGQQIHQGEADEALFKAVSNVAGILFKLPSGQINKTVLGADALIEGETDNPLAIVAGPPRK